MKHTLLVSLVLALCLLAMLAVPLSATGAELAGKPLPAAFSGSVTVNGEPAPVGTVIKAVGNGVEIGAGFSNPIQVAVAGQYGDQGFLLVQGNYELNTVITFYVNDVPTGQTYTITQYGEIVRMDIVFTGQLPTSGGTGGTGGTGSAGGTGGGTTPGLYDPNTVIRQFTADFLGQTTTFSVNDEGILLQPIALSKPGEPLVLSLSEGMSMLDKNGDPLTGLTIQELPTYPPPPADNHVFGLPLDLGPDGATFSPPITAFFRYEPELIPASVDENDLVIAFYDEDAGEWVILPCEVIPGESLIKVMIDHFCAFAIFYPVSPVGTTSPSPTKTTSAPATEPVTTVTIIPPTTAQPAAPSVTPTTAQPAPTVTSVAPTQSHTTAPVTDQAEQKGSSSMAVWYIVGVTVIVLGIIGFVYLRRYARWL